MKKFIALASIVASLAVATAAQATQYVQNGDFSFLSKGLGQIDSKTVATGWSSTGYNFVMNKADVGSNGDYGNLPLWDATNGGSTSWNGMSPNGDNFVAMDGAFGVSPVTQTITGLTAGKTYELSFTYAFAQQYRYNGDTLQHISASFGGNSVFTSSPDFALSEHDFSGWTTYSGTVTATGATQVLSFLAYGNKPVPPFALLTDVSLTGAVPEPATWGMMLVGLGAMGAMARRRRWVLAAA